MKQRTKLGGTLRPGARNILAPPPMKTTELEVKNKWTSAEEAKVKHVCYFVIF